MIIALSVLNFCIDKGLHKTEFANFKEWNDIFMQKINPDVFIQGSSRAKVQYSTFILDSVLDINSYNMGMDGSLFDVQYLRFKECLINGIIPKFIIQNVDYEFIESNDKAYLPGFFLPYLNNDNFKEQIKTEHFLPAYKTTLPIFKYAGELKVVTVGLLEASNLHHFYSDRHKGYVNQDFKWDGSHFEKRKRTQKEKQPFNLDNDSLFRNFLTECNQHQIKVIMVYSPAYCKLNDYLDTEKIFDYYKAIAKKYEIPFLNYYDDNISFDKANYHNATHLNKTGAELFTTKLAHDIDSLGILK
jgi:hypothetical protein